MTKLGILNTQRPQIIKIKACLNTVKSTIEEKKNTCSYKIQIKSELRRLRDEWNGRECDVFLSDVALLYESCVQYLEKWTASFKEFKCVDWMLLIQNTEWRIVEPCVEYLLAKKCFRLMKSSNSANSKNLCKFVEKQLQSNSVSFCKLMAHERWTEYFKSCSTSDFNSELIKIAQYYFSILRITPTLSAFSL